ncbi:MAG: T9SS type A sorting domain-containing protein [Bacteroidales bacterium]|nr:T9SS type A sorting domain-containing protein [Bacteroidales bacterium]
MKLHNTIPAASLLVTILNLAVPATAQDDPSTNLALTATLSTSYVSPWETLDAVNDGYEPASSSDNSHGAYGNWNGEASYNTWNWVEVEFDRPNQVDSVRVYWWDDGAGIDQPTAATIEYWDCDAFVKAGDIGTSLHQYNTLEVDIFTNRIRVNMISAMATGILELQVFGIESEPVTILPFISINHGDTLETGSASVIAGDTLLLIPVISGAGDGSWRWTGPGGCCSSDSVLALDSILPGQSGVYIAEYLLDCGFGYNIGFNITVKLTGNGAYTWPAYYPTLDYNFREEYPELEMPVQDLDDCPQVVGSQSSGWWTFRWGPNKRSLVTEAAITPMLERMNTDFAYFRDVMGWPPDKRAKNGYRSAIYLFGSGLTCSDNADSTELGGWQSSIFYNGESWPMVLLSYYPVYCFDPSCPYSDREFQMGAVVHEGIHAILADLPGAREAAWFHEGGNTWLQQEAEARRSGDFSSMGFLNGVTFIAPFIPIECYSGWLQDDSFGGPSAEGVNMYDGNQQICTWRNFLGGNQYGNIFPTFLSQILGDGSVPWIWRYCPERVLEGMADTLGDLQMRRLIVEYRAKQALTDIGPWTGAVRKLLNDHFKSNIRAEWSPSWLKPDLWVASPYARTTLDENGVLTPEYRTTPGWSGANQIPLLVKGDSVTITFQPIGKNMSCQLCYRDVNGNQVYGEPVTSGQCSLVLDSPPANDVVIAVVVNTDYAYEGEKTRTAHFDYRIMIDTALTVPAHTHKRWYNWDGNPLGDVPPALPPITPPDTFPVKDLLLELDVVYENLAAGTEIGLFTAVDSNNVNTHTFQFVTGEGDDGNSRFRINGNKLFLNSVLDYETSPSHTIRVRATDAYGNRFDKAFEIPVADVEPETRAGRNISDDGDLLLYPNPVTDILHINIPPHSGELKQVRILSMQGSVVYENSLTGSEAALPMERNIPAGLFLLQIQTEESVLSRKIIRK